MPQLERAAFPICGDKQKLLKMVGVQGMRPKLNIGCYSLDSQLENSCNFPSHR
ncbi:MAG UNVERIFIED_CONTAM: hypothetical protein LVR29_11810 [Microcystis novacekii LVE1205-3]